MSVRDLRSFALSRKLRHMGFRGKGQKEYIYIHYQSTFALSTNTIHLTVYTVPSW